MPSIKVLNDIINLEILFDRILDMLLRQNNDSSSKLTEQFDFDILISGYFSLLQRIIEIEPKIKNDKKTPKIVETIFKECIWNDTRNGDQSKNITGNN